MYIDGVMGLEARNDLVKIHDNRYKEKYLNYYRKI